MVSANGTEWSGISFQQSTGDGRDVLGLMGQRASLNFFLSKQCCIFLSA